MNNIRLTSLFLALALLSSCSHLPSWMGGKKEEKARLPGERIAVLPSTEDFHVDNSVKDMPVTLPAPTMNPDWPQHGDTIPAAAGNLAALGTFDTMSHATAGSGESFGHMLIPQPVVGGGLVFAMDAVGNLSAHETAHIENIRWKSKGVFEKDAPDVMGGGLAYHQGKLYAVSGRGTVAAFDATTGNQLWRKSFHIPLRSAPRIDSGRLFVITIDNQIYALDIATGELLWDQRGISEVAGLMNSVSPTIDGNTIIVPYSSGEIYALAADTGKEIWSDSLSPGKHTEAGANFTGIGGDPVTDGGVVFAASSAGMMSVFALGNGQHVWDKPFSTINTPWLTGDYLFLLTADNTLTALVKYSGRIRWAVKLRSFENQKEKRNPITWRGPVMVGGKLAVVSSYGELLFINAADGKIAATKEVPKHIYTAPIIAGGRIYLITQDATLYTLQ